MNPFFFLRSAYFRTMKRKVTRLDVPVEFDFELLAILTGLKDYRLCYEINKKLNLKFTRQKDAELKDALNNRSEFAHFRCFNEITREEIILIYNKGSNGILIPEMKNIDYFMLIKNHPPGEVDGIMKSMNEMENISGVYKLNPAELKSAENFLIFEAHEKPATHFKPY